MQDALAWVLSHQEWLDDTKECINLFFTVLRSLFYVTITAQEALRQKTPQYFPLKSTLFSCFRRRNLLTFFYTLPLMPGRGQWELLDAVTVRRKRLRDGWRPAPLTSGVDYWNSRLLHPRQPLSQLLNRFLVYSSRTKLHLIADWICSASQIRVVRQVWCSLFHLRFDNPTQREC